MTSFVPIIEKSRFVRFFYFPKSCAGFYIQSNVLRIDFFDILLLNIDLFFEDQELGYRA